MPVLVPVVGPDPVTAPVLLHAALPVTPHPILSARLLRKNVRTAPATTLLRASPRKAEGHHRHASARATPSHPEHGSSATVSAGSEGATRSSSPAMKTLPSQQCSSTPAAWHVPRSALPAICSVGGAYRHASLGNARIWRHAASGIQLRPGRAPAWDRPALRSISPSGSRGASSPTICCPPSRAIPFFSRSR